LDAHEVAAWLHGVDSFHKNAILLFDDLVSHVKEQAYAGVLQNLTGPEYWYNVYNPTDSESIRWWAFDTDGVIRFLTMLVKVHDRYLRGDASAGQFKDVCRQLKRDPRFPLLIIYGTFAPRDMQRFRQDNSVRRQWLKNAALLDLRSEHRMPSATDVEFGHTLTLESSEGTDSYWCERADLVLWDLLSIRNSEDVAVVGRQLLGLAPTPNPPPQPTRSADG